MKSFINELKEIKKDELDERSFYEQVLSIIQKMTYVSLTPETAEQLKTALEEIGCMRYDEWKAEKDKNGETIEENNVYDGYSYKCDISTAVEIVSSIFEDENDLDVAKANLRYITRSAVPGWLASNKTVKIFKMNAPYYSVAKEALMNWNGLTKEEAENIISSQTFDEIEAQVYAKGSMDYAIDGILKYFSDKMEVPVIDSDRKDLANFVYNGSDSRIASSLELMASSQKTEQLNDMIMDTLFAVHDGWVKDNQKKFMARDKKHQHMPSELIGWKEAKADLLFIRPIFERAGVEVNEETLEQVYNDRVKEFFLDRGITTSRQLSDSITKGEEFYPALAGYGDVLVNIKNPDYVDEHVIPAVEQKGIGKIEDVRKNIVAQIINNPTAEDIERLTESEKAQVEQTLGQEVDTLTVKRDELQQKNSIVQRIVTLAQRRSAIKKEISIEEQNKSKNIQSLDD